MVNSKKILFLASATLLVFASLSALACTSFRLISPDGGDVFAWNFEFAVDVKPNVIFLPRNFEFNGHAPHGRKALDWKSHYAVVGVNAFNIQLVSGGINEKGLGVASLYLNTTSEYQEVSKKDDGNIIASFDVPTYLLSNFATVAEAKKALEHIKVAEVPTKQWKNQVVRIHFRIDDASGASAVVEYVNGQFKFYDNPLGVMTNEPTFDWHISNLRNYIDLTPYSTMEADFGKLHVIASGTGSGLHGLPGDFTPASRFVRATIYSQFITSPKNAEEALYQTINLSQALLLPHGLTRIKTFGRTLINYTQWIVMGDLKYKQFYFRSYENPNWFKVDLTRVQDLAEAKIIPFRRPSVINDVTAEIK
jgi:choloylglycine hydrolase